MPKGELEDVIAYHNPEDPNNPKIRVVPAGKGKEIVRAQKANAMMQKEMKNRMTAMKDNSTTRWKMVRFIAQEVAKDKKIQHFDREAIGEVIREAQRRSGRQGQISLRFRELGGLIRAAGDIANEKKSKIVYAKHVLKGRKIARSLEQQVADRYIEKRKSTIYIE